jgi:glutamate-1-semialdehyde aminotransferase
LFGVIPDLACIGKGLSNGYPLSAVVGRSDLMKLFEEIFFSSTAGGETLSLAAALSTITKCKNEPVIETLKNRGARLIDGVNELLRQFEITHIFEISGHPSWSFLKINDSGGFSESEIRTLFMQETLARGIIMLGTHDICYAHSEEDIEGLIQVYREVFPIIGEAVAENNLLEKLRCDPLKPLFEVRKDSMDRA